MPYPAKGRRSSSETRTVRGREDSRSEILDAAEEEFAKLGFIAASTEAIAARTGVSKSMIYYCFKTKEELYLAVLKRAFTERLSLPAGLNLDQLPPEPALQQFLQWLLACMSSNHNLTAILSYESLQNKGKYFRQIGALNIYSTLINILERGIVEGTFRSLDSRQTAINIVGTCIFYFISHENLKPLYPGKRMLSKELDRKSVV